MWGFFKPEPYGVVIIAAAIIPLTALAIARLSQGLIRFHEHKNSAYPSIILGILTPSAMLFLRAIMDFNLLSYDTVLQYIIVIPLFVCALVFVRNKEFTFKKGQDYLVAIVVVFFFAAYSFGAVVTLNGHFDNSEADAFSVKVLDKHMSSGKTTT
jgi:hypothetical protein